MAVDYSVYYTDNGTVSEDLLTISGTAVDSPADIQVVRYSMKEISKAM